MTEILNLERLGELINHPVRLKGGELEAICKMAAKGLQANEFDTRLVEFENLRVALDEHTKRLATTTRLYSEAQQAIAGRTRDLAATDNYVQSLVGRLQDSLAKERSIREWQKEFEWSVQKCIDREKLGPVAGLNPTLLRLQEALEPPVFGTSAPAE